MAWHFKNVPKAIQDLIFDKQAVFSKEKGKKVSIEKTVERLLREAYLKEKAAPAKA